MIFCYRLLEGLFFFFLQVVQVCCIMDGMESLGLSGPNFFE